MKRKKIAIVGTGLIGGSLAIRLHEKKISSLLLGVETNPVHASKAVELELVDEIVSLEEAINRADVVILTIPVDTIVEILPGLMDKISDQIVVDLGSTKREALNVLKGHPSRRRYVATHPMWGTEYSGPAAALPGAFEKKAVIICNAGESDADAIEWVKWMYKKIGMHILEMDAAAHDLHTAYVSHISHITSFALANTVLEKETAENTIFELASAGFESTVRLAKSNASMWVPIFIQNRDNVIDVLTEHIAQLSRFKESMEKNDHQSLGKLITNANKIKKVLR